MHGTCVLCLPLGFLRYHLPLVSSPTPKNQPCSCRVLCTNRASPRMSFTPLGIPRTPPPPLLSALIYSHVGVMWQRFPMTLPSLYLCRHLEQRIPRLHCIQAQKLCHGTQHFLIHSNVFLRATKFATSAQATQATASGLKSTMSVTVAKAVGQP